MIDGLGFGASFSGASRSRLRRIGCGVAVVAGLALAPAMLLAEPSGAGTSSVAPSAGSGAGAGSASGEKPLPPGFQRVAGAPESEKIDANPLVVAAYAVIFAGVFGYIVYVARSQAAMAREMMALSERIRRVEKK